MNKKSNLSELMSYAGKRKYLTYMSWILSAASALISLLPFIYIWLIIKEVLEVQPDFSKATGIVHNGWMAVIFSLISMGIYFGALMCSHVSAFRVAGNIRKKAMRHVTELPLGFTGEMGSGRIRRIVNESSAATETYLAHELPDMAGAIALPVGMLVILFVIDWRFGLVSLIPVVLGFLAMFKMAGPSMAHDMQQYQNAMEAMNNEAVEYVRGVPVVKTFGQTVFSFKRFKASIDNYYKFCISYTKKCRTPMLIFTTCINSTFAFLIVLGLALSRSQTGGEAVLINLVFYIIFTPVIVNMLTKVMYMSENLMMVNDALQRIHSILDEKPLAEPVTAAVPEDNSVEFSNVTFRYKNADTNAIENVSFKVDSGQTVALVGPSGGGKTTVAGLLSRFWDVNQGEIRIGNINVREIGKRNLAETISYVFQDSRLLKMSIFENVRLARPNATREQVWDALHRAQCDDIVEKLPQGIDTVIGTKGIYLSGGEQQRISIARAILKDSPILVLDEATAFADPENEVLVQKAFEELAKNKTVIMIAHRLTTIKNADCIYVLKDGSIEECGTHAALLEKDGLYHKMWNDYQTTISWKVGGAKC